MDLLAIARKIWRHRLLTVPVIALTVFGAVYVVAVKEPVYEASSSYLLVNPPEVPTAEAVEQNPALGQVRADNPYTRFADQSVVVDVLARTMSTDSARRALVRAGADERYTVAPDSQFGSSKPILQITGTGPTPLKAVRTATVVGRAVIGELERVQRVQQIDSRYQITALQVEVPDGARLQASGQMRMLVGVLALGAILLFIVVSVAEALHSLRRERGAAMKRDEWLPDEFTAVAPTPNLDVTLKTNGRRDRVTSLREQLRSDL
jgi:hypothetical protein